jgi:hypothetical protein
MKHSQTLRSLFVVAGLAFVGAAATLPLTLDTIRSYGQTKPAMTLRAPTVKLICFDRHMQANECTVAPTATMAAK